VPVIQVPYFDNIGVNDVNEALEAMTNEIGTRTKATPVF